MSPINKPDEDSNLHDVLERLSVIESKLETLEAQNSETLTLLRILAQPVLSSSLQDIFKTPKQLFAYELSDGERSTRDIGKLVKLDQKGISNWWRDWEKEGLVEKVGKRGQFKASYSLLELLLVYSPTKKPKPSKESKDG